MRTGALRRGASMNVPQLDTFPREGRSGPRAYRVAAALLALLCIIILWPVSTSAGISPDSEWIKQADRFRWSVFCADTTEPPKPDAMATALLGQHPSFQPLAEWLNEFVALRRERCKDA